VAAGEGLEGEDCGMFVQRCDGVVYRYQRYRTDPVHPEFSRHGPSRTTLFGSIVEETHTKDRLLSVSQVSCNSGEHILIRRLGAKRPWSLLQSFSWRHCQASLPLQASS
jgi:hypothetical protein